MSYEIVYERQFLKLDIPNCDVPWIIPLTLHGSNNCTEYSYNGRERRVRDWGGIYFNGPNQLPIAAPTIMMERIESYCGGEYQQHFKRFGKYVDDAGLIRFFKNGIKDAKTLEEINEMSQTRIYLDCYLSVWNQSENNVELRRVVTDSKELLEFLLEAKLRIRNRVDSEQIYVQIGFPSDKAIPHLKSEYVVKRKPKTYDTEYWVLKSLYHGGNVYVSQLTAKSLRYSYYQSSARKFGSEKEAIRWVNTKLRSKGFRKEIIESLIPERVEVK